MASVGALIIAHTNPQRALLPIGEQTLLRRMAEACLAVGASPVCITIPQADTALSVAVNGLPVIFSQPHADSDMFSAVVHGIKGVFDTTERLFVSPVCIPPFSETLLSRMLGCDRPVCRPVRGGIGLHPVLLDRSAMERVAAYRGTDGLRGALRQFSPEEVCFLPTDSINGGLHPEIQVRIADDTPFFGPVPRQLLLGIRAKGSVLKACEAVGISYSKGRSLLRRMEEALGATLVSRTQGGTGGGSATLTEEGERFLSRYACYEQAVFDYAAAVFSEYFPKDADDLTDTEESNA